MTISESISTCFSKFATFSGRATRSEFWWFTLFSGLVNMVGDILTSVFHAMGDVEAAMSMSLVHLVLMLVVLVPNLAVGARRLHDIGRSGWWQLLIITIIGYIVLIIFWVKKGDQHGNEYDQQENKYDPLP